jgi:hypothetical protein
VDDSSPETAAAPTSSGARLQTRLPSLSPEQQTLFEGFLTDEQMCEAFDCGQRTLERHVTNGLPFTRVGNLRLFSITTTREYIASQTQVRVPRQARGRGRPRKEPQRRRGA